nr:hypothetical protein [Sodalis glossinidius]
MGLSQMGYYFIGGLLRHGRALCAAFAPTVNSYKRLVRQGAMNYFSWVPVFNSYGFINRTNSVRVPAGGGRCESRNADGAETPIWWRRWRPGWRGSATRSIPAN